MAERPEVVIKQIR